jgi:hypothetical protein
MRMRVSGSMPPSENRINAASDRLLRRGCTQRAKRRQLSIVKQSIWNVPWWQHCVLGHPENLQSMPQRRRAPFVCQPSPKDNFWEADFD